MKHSINTQNRCLIKPRATITKFIAVLLLMMLMMIPPPAQAGSGLTWVSMSSGTGSNLQGVWGSSNTDVFAVGDNGKIIHYDGTSWSSMTSLPATYHLNDVWGTANNNVFAVGDYGKIRHYNGSNWSTMSSGTTDNLYGVWGSASDDVYAVGYQYSIYGYNGSTWSQVSRDASFTDPYQAVWGTSNDDVFVVGSLNSTTHYNGNAWTGTSGCASGNGLNGVWGNSSSSVFAVGYNGNICRYNKGSWSSMTSGTSEDFSSVWGSSGSNVFATTFNGAFEFNQVRYYNGTSWVSDASKPASFNDVWGSSATNVFVVGDGGKIYHGGIPPQVGTVTASDVTTSNYGETSYDFTVQYTDNEAVNISSLDDNDVTVTGVVSSTFVSVDNGSNGTPRTSTYRITPPGGSWDKDDNGTYTIGVASDQVLDNNGMPVAANSNIGSFTVNISAQAPTDISLSANTVAENEEAATIGTLSTTDPDSDSHAYSITVASADLFEISDDTLKLKSGKTTDYETTISYPITIKTEDRDALSYTESFTISVTDVNEAPVLASIGDKSVLVNNPLSFTASATDPEDNTLQFSLTSPPAGATINASSGLFSWTPDTVDNFSLTVKVDETNGNPSNLNDSEAITIFVTNFSCSAVNQIPTNQCNALLSLYNSTNGASWSDVASNNWTVTDTPCSWTGITCSGGQVTEISRDGKNLVGVIPDLSALTSLQKLWVQNNQLSGDIPTSLSSLSSLSNLDLGYNKLTASDSGLITFLNSKDSNWANTQTVPPTNLSAIALSATSIQVGWTPILYTADGGYYQVKYSSSSGGPYTAAGNTADKTIFSYDVTNLSPATTYYFVVESYTPAHGSQSNNLTSELSAKVSATTPTPGATLSAMSGNTGEDGTSGTFTMTLTSPPEADVSIPILSSDPTEGKVSPAIVTFTPTDWNIPQTITATGVDDNLTDGNQTYTIQTGMSSSADISYHNLDFADVTVINMDNDSPGFNVSSISGDTGEDGTTATFTIKLNTEPTAEVTIPLSSSDSGEGSVSPMSVAFSPNNWNIAQTVTVTGVDDMVTDGDQTYTIKTGSSSSTDSNYNNLDPADVTVINMDNDTSGITVSEISGDTGEDGTSATFTIKLNTKPTAEVTIPLSSSDSGEGTVSPMSVTFSPNNWSIAQTVTVIGVDDNLTDGNQTYTIQTGNSSSTDSSYNDLDSADVTVINVDNDSPGITVSKISGDTGEDGTTATFTIKLNTEPTAEVTISLSSSDSGEGTVSPMSVTFSPNNWSIAQTVTVTGVDDNLVDGNQTYTIQTGKSSSTDSNYNNLDPADLSLINMDNDSAPPPVGKLQVVPSTLSFEIRQDDTTTETKSLLVTNIGQGTLTWVANDDAIWLNLSKTSGSLTPSASDIMTVSIVSMEADNLATGIYTGYITFSDNDVTSTDYKITTTLKILEPAGSPKLTISKNASTVVEPNAPLTYTLTVANIGTLTATNLVITDALPVGATYLSGGNLIDSAVVSWMQSYLPPNRVVKVSFAVSSTQAITNRHYWVGANGGYSATGKSAVATQLAEPTSGSGDFRDDGQTLSQGNVHAVAIADLNNDGYLDIFIANYGSGTRQNNGAPNEIWFNDGHGQLTDSQQVLGDSASTDVALGYLNDDTYIDAFVANDTGQPNQIWFNDGHGNFNNDGQNIGQQSSNTVSLGDFDGDEHLDAVIANGEGEVSQVWFNDGSGVFSNSEQILGTSNSQAVGLGDVNADGDLDIILGNGDNQSNQIWFNDGSGVFSSTNQILGATDTQAVAIADFNADGALDMFVGNGNNQADEVWFNDGTGIFSNTEQTLGSDSSKTITIGDIDEDGDLDTIVGSEGQDVVWFNDGQGNFSEDDQFLGTENSQAVGLGDFDNDGDLDVFIGTGEGQDNKILLNLDETKTMFDANTGGLLTEPSKGITIEIPAGTYNKATEFNYVSFLAVEHPVPSNLRFADVTFRLEAVQDGALAPMPFYKPISMTLRYDSTKFVGDNLFIYYWDKQLLQWVEASTTCDPSSTYMRTENLITLPVCHLTDFAMFEVEKQQRVYLPVIVRE
ncbi:FG-GAP-like repeat-containing protein [Anaerolineales bacterium HSG24]|nr:FG-GAP-like repeat-containing protein [Anaerolineales bacterium HSG24]